MGSATLFTSEHTCGVITSGAAYCWGANPFGQLGTGSTTPSTVPVAVAGGLAFSALSASGLHTCGLATDGVAYCWGNNTNGQLGIGTTISSDVPVKVLAQQ
jgi:alpha-tubulin suppressor-like RCC1 family protein